MFSSASHGGYSDSDYSNNDGNRHVLKSDPTLPGGKYAPH
jgi:hypothetical protein